MRGHELLHTRGAFIETPQAQHDLIDQGIGTGTNHTIDYNLKIVNFLWALCFFGQMDIHVAGCSRGNFESTTLRQKNFQINY